MSPKSQLKSLKARFKRILSDRDGRKNHEFNDSASSSSSERKKLPSQSRFKMKRSWSTNSSVNRKMKKVPSPVRTDVSSSSSSSDNITGSPREVRRKTKKLSSSSSEFSSDGLSRNPAKSIKKLQLISLESRLKLPLHETSQVSPSSKIFASDIKVSPGRDQRGSRRALWSTTLSPATSTEPSSPALPRYSSSLNDSSAPSSPGRAEKINFSEELRASRSSDPTRALRGNLEGNADLLSKTSSPKVKRIQSAFLDEERGVWRCRNCDWIYPNPNPTARHRREHKKHCGEMLNVQQWLTVIDPGKEDIQDPVKEIYEEGPSHEVVQLGAEVGKAPLPSDHDQGESVNNSVLCSNRAEACEDMIVQDPVDEAERGREEDDVKSESVDRGNMIEGSTADNCDVAAEITLIGEDVSKPDAESGEDNSHNTKISDNTVVVNGFADNDAEGQGTAAEVGTVNSPNGELDDVGDVTVQSGTVSSPIGDLDDVGDIIVQGGTVNSPNGDLDDVGDITVQAGTVNSANEDLDDDEDITVQAERNIEGIEEEKEPRDAEVTESELVQGSDCSEAFDSWEQQDYTQGDGVSDSAGTDGPRQQDLRGLHSETNDGILQNEVEGVDTNHAGQDVQGPVEDFPSESSGDFEGAEREFTLGENKGDEYVKEEINFGTVAADALHEYEDSVKGLIESFESEHQNSMKEEHSVVGSGGAISSLDSGDASHDHVTVGNGENVGGTLSSDLREDDETDPVEQAHYEPSVELNTGGVANAGDILSSVLDSSAEKGSAERNPLLCKTSTSSSSSSSSSSDGDDNDSNSTSAPDIHRSKDPPASGNQGSPSTLWNGRNDAIDAVSQAVKEITTTAWRSRNSVQDEVLESIIDESTSSSWTRPPDCVPLTDDSKLAITSAITAETWQSPPGKNVARTSVPSGVGTAGSAIKKEDFKHRQTFWAAITRSDILESSQKSPSSTSSPYERIQTVVNAAESPKSVTSSPSQQGSRAKEVVVSNSVSSHVEASTSSFHLEASTSKFHPASVASSSTADSVDEYDLERVIHEQKTHDIMCPVCGSCITKRVILRKRKRYLPLEDPKRPRLPVPPALEPPSPELEKRNGWGCLACLSLFLFKGDKEEVREKKEDSSCLEIVFPTFPWGRRVTDAAEEIPEPEPDFTPTPVHQNVIHPQDDDTKPREEGCTSYLSIFKRPPAQDGLRQALLPPDSDTADNGANDTEPPSTQNVFSPVTKEKNWFSYLKMFKAFAPGSPEPALRPSDNDTTEPGRNQPEPSSTPTPSGEFFQPKEQRSSVEFRDSVISEIVPERIWPEQTPEKPGGLVEEKSPPDGRPEEMPLELGVENDVGEPTAELLPTSLSPHVSDSEPSSPVQTGEVKQLPLPVKPLERDRCDCFEIFLPVFPWGPSDSKTEQDTSSVIPGPVFEDPQVVPGPAPEIPPTDRQCTPLFWFSRRSPEQSEEEDIATAVAVVNPDVLSAPQRVEQDPLQRADSPVSPPPRECLPFLRSALYSKSYVSEETKPSPEMVQREPWRDYKDWGETTTFGLYVRQFYDPLPPITHKPRPSVHYSPPVPPVQYSPPAPPEPLQRSVPELILKLPREPLQDTDGSPATSCIDVVIPTFPLGAPVEDPEVSPTNCLDLVLPTFPWGPSVEEPSRFGAEEQPPPSTSRSPPEHETDPKQAAEPPPSTSRSPPEHETDSKQPVAPPPSTSRSQPEHETDSKQPVEPTQHTRPSERPAEEENRHISNKFVGHFVREEVIVTSSHIEVIKDTTHIESLLDSENRILTLEEIRDKPSKASPFTADLGTAGPSKEASDLAQRVAQGVQSLNRQTPSGVETHQEPVYHGDSCSCLPFGLPKLSWSWHDHPGGTRTSSLTTTPVVVSHLPVPSVTPLRPDPYEGITQDEHLKEPLLQRHEIEPAQSGSSAAGGIHSVVDIPVSTPLQAPDTLGESPEIIKSLVYGGLDTTLISLGVVSSATGGDASTINVIAIGVANVVFGFLVFLGTISSLYKTDVARFKQLVGPSYRLNGLLAVFAYLVFGLLPPITYGFSFRHKTNRDWKMGATCLVVLVSLVFLGWGKARVTSQKPYLVILTLITTGFVAALASYQVGDYVTWLLKDLGFDSL